VVTTGALIAIIIWHLAVWTWSKDPGMVVLTVFIAAVLPMAYLFHFDDKDQRRADQPRSDQ
jgi:Tfp pilus assembly protein PilO